MESKQFVPTIPAIREQPFDPTDKENTLFCEDLADDIRYQRIFTDNVNRIDLSGMLDEFDGGKKGTLVYMRWAYAVRELMHQFPGSTWDVGTDPVNGIIMLYRTRLKNENQGYSILVTLNLNVGSLRSPIFVKVPEYYPVLNKHNDPELNPDCSDINKAQKRALVKLIAMTTGFGLPLYCGEVKSAVDLAPQAEIDELYALAAELGKTEKVTKFFDDADGIHSAASVKKTMDSLLEMKKRRVERATVAAEEIAKNIPTP